jgi:predicted DNA-binding protein with PD1-like motif
MQYDEGRLGRIFVLRLEEGDRLPDSIETFARAHSIKSGIVVYLGGADDGSRMVVGPEANRGEAVIPIIHVLKGIQEVLALGTLFPNESGEPVLHLHAAAGREGNASVGCTRAGVDVWLVGEVVVFELLGTSGQRKKDPHTGFELLQLPHSE